MSAISTVLTGVLMTTAGKLLAALGVGFVSYAGINYMQGKFAAWLSGQLGNLPTDMLNIFYMSGGGVFLNWIFGAIAFVASIKATAKLTATMKTS